MSKPRAVLISDVHYNINTIDLANAAMRAAIEEANELEVPFIVAGDLHDTKAILRGECIKAMLDTFSLCETEVFVLVGNHCKLSEKGDGHALEFLAHKAAIISSPLHDSVLALYLIPYYSSSEALQAYLNTVPKGSTLIMHQGVATAYLGHYVQDKSSLPKEAFQDFRVISGHYHRAQDIRCGRPRKGAVGLFSYIGNPYTLSFGEANDGPKGYAVLMDDGTLERIPLNLRKHVVLERTVESLYYQTTPGMDFQENDLVWLKLTGPSSELDKLTKEKIGKEVIGHTNFKLDKIYTDVKQIAPAKKNETEAELFDRIIDATEDTAEAKAALKTAWRALV